MSFDVSQLLAQAKAVQPTAQQWFVPAPAPEVDPFEAKPAPWNGFRRPQEPRLTPGQWLRTMYSTLEKRFQSGAVYLERTDIDEMSKERAFRLWCQLGWQVHLIEQIAKQYTPCPNCPRVIGGTFNSQPTWIGEFAAWQFKEHFAEAEIPVTTPGGLRVTLVPWPTGGTDPRELTPEDMAALARIGRLANIDNELEVLDRILEPRDEQVKGDSQS